MQGKLVDQPLPDFSLSGGPLHRLGCRLRLVREGNTVALGMALGLAAWAVLMALAFLEGYGGRVFSMDVLGIHVRLLLAIPLAFLCGTCVFPRMTEWVREMVRSGIVPESEFPALASAIRQVGRLKDSWQAELLFLLIVIALSRLDARVNLSGRTGNWAAIVNQAAGGLTWSHGWYLGFCLPLIRFILLRWIWRLGLWIYFLWRVGKLDLQLVPTHPDGAGGLGYLEIVQEHFAPLVLAISSIYAASYAELITTGVMAFESLARLIPVILLLVLAGFIGPLALFSVKLWRCRVDGWSDYMAMASRYVKAFDRKWVRDETATGDSQLGTGDLQSLADLGNSLNVVRQMRVIPASQRLVLSLAGCVLVPMLPLLLLKYPIDQLVRNLFQTLTGL